MNTRDTIHALTGGKPFVFVIMSYRTHMSGVFEIIEDVIREKFNLACIRADQVPSAGHDLLSKIHEIINRAELVIAEITDPEPGKPSPNVFYEIGYAVAVQKPPLLLIEAGHQRPTDLKGLEAIEYQNRLDGREALKLQLAKQVRFHLSSELAVLHDMLEAPRPAPSYIVSSPKYPGPQSRIKGQVYDTRTFGDHLGILGLISAFGSMFGEAKGIELISAQHAPPDLADMDVNLYLIGSGKVNAPAERLFKGFMKDRIPCWSFDPSKGARKGDWTVALYRTQQGAPQMMRGEAQQCGKRREWVWTSDYGLILRGPHPRHEGRLVLVLAGAHSLGTGAACLAATHSSLIKKLRESLPVGVLEDKKKTFWALVKGEVNKKDFLLDEDGVTIEEAGVYD